MNIISFLAQATQTVIKAPATVAPSVTAAPAPAPNPAPGWFQMLQNPSQLLLPLGAGVVLLMLMGRKNGGADDKKRVEMLKQLKRGDRIETIGGIQGAVVRTEESRVEVKVDESSNTKIWFSRSAIRKVLEAANAETK